MAPPTTIRQILLIVMALGIFLGLLVGFYVSTFPAVAAPAPGYLTSPSATPMNMACCS
jgi:hypothetical protein